MSNIIPKCYPGGRKIPEKTRKKLLNQLMKVGVSLKKIRTGKPRIPKTARSIARVSKRIPRTKRTRGRK